jgi:hypothetical protein
MSETCLFCNLQEKGCEPPQSVHFICSRCVQLLLAADQADLRRVHEKAVRLGYMGKVDAIKTFLVEDQDAETEKVRRNLERKRPMPTVRPARDQVRA